MFSRFCRRTTLLCVRPSSSVVLLQSQIPPLLLLVKQLISSTASSEPGSFTLSYLINSCGLSPESASSVSKIIQLKTPTKPDAVIDFFKNHGFSQNHISTMIRKLPPLLLAKPEKTLLPKLDYMYSIGVSRSEVVRIFSGYPWVFRRNLKKHIIPTFDFLRGFLQSDEKAVAAVRRNISLLSSDLDRNLKPNITTLIDNGVEDCKIAYLVLYHSRVLLTEVWRFNQTVEKVKELGFNPKKFKFVFAIKEITEMSELTWKKKIGIYRSWGWSEESIHKAFIKDPFCMKLSEDKLMAAMDFFVNEVGVDSSIIAQHSEMLRFSLEKRTIPRFMVLKSLVLKGLIKRKYNMTTLLAMSARSFEDKFLEPFLKEAPELMDIYERKYSLETSRQGSSTC